MGLFDRFKTVVKSNINAFMDQVEDPEKLMEQAILDMREKKAQALQLLKESMARVQLIKNKGELSQEEASHQDQQIQGLKENIRSFETAIQSAIKKQTELKSRIIRAKAKQSTAAGAHLDLPQKDHVNDNEAFETFDRMAEKIDEAEALNDAHAELESDFSKSAEKDALDVKTQALKLDADLIQFKKSMAADSASNANLDDAARSIEDELAKMKK